MISGMGVPDVDVRFADPAQLQDELLKRFTPDQLVERSVAHFGENYGEYLLQTVDNHLAVLRHLLRRYPDTNLLCGVFTASDRAQHFYWRQMEDPSAPPRQRTMIQEVYMRLDQALGALIAECPDYTVLVMSDHGAGPYHRLINLNQWLASHGWLQWQASNGEGSQSTHDWRHWYRQLGLLLPYRLRRQIKNILPTAWMQRLRAEVRRTSLPVHWATTQAYSLGVSGAIYLNLIGREPLGCVRPGHEAEMLLAEIERALYTLSDPDTGEPVVERVDRGPELYRGPAIHLAPDLVVSWKPGYYALSHWSPNGTIFRGHLRWENSEMVHSAEHRPEGILLALGPGIRKGAHITGASIIDLAPTVLHLMGLPIPSYMDGKVLIELLDARQIGRDPVYVDGQGKSKQSEPSSYSESEEREIINRLRDLGYLG
jgi:predicted AlkP superfamily phosphohydrolase/phosphomutase